MIIANKGTNSGAGGYASLPAQLEKTNQSYSNIDELIANIYKKIERAKYN